MRASLVPGLSELVFEAIPLPPPTLSALLPGVLQQASEAKVRKSLESRIDAINSLAARLHLHSRLSNLEELPVAVRRELTQTEASTWALLCYVNLILNAHGAACDSGHRVLEQFSDLPSAYQIFATRLIKALVVRIDDDDLFDEIQQASERLHERDRLGAVRLVQVQRGIAKARNRELPAALSILRGVATAEVTNDLASMLALFSMARIFETEQLAWEELQCCLRWRDALRESEKLSVAEYAGRLAENGVSVAAVVETGLRLISLLRSADRHQEADALISEFESAGFGEQASILKSQKPRADGWSVQLIDDSPGDGDARAHAAIYKLLVSGQSKYACVALRRGGYDEPVSRVVDSESDPIAHLISDLPDKVSGLGLEVIGQALVDNALSTYQWILLREQHRPISGLLIGLLSTGSNVSATAIRCIAFPTRIEEGRDKEWLREAVELLTSDFDAAKRYGALQAVDQIFQRLAPAGTRVRVTEI